MEKLLDDGEDLIHTIQQLRESIDSAVLAMVGTHGEEHPSVVRLRSYYPALDKQLVYAAELRRHLAEQKLDEYPPLIAKIRAISDMIRMDARSMVSRLTTGKDIAPEQEFLN